MPQTGKKVYPPDSMRYLVGFGNKNAFGRLCVLGGNILGVTVGNLTGGVFFAGFMLASGMGTAEIGVLGAIPFFMSFLAIFTPFILGPLKRRKPILLVSRLCFYGFYLGAISFVPLLPISHTAKFWLCIVMTVVGYGWNMLFVQGMNVWHTSFLQTRIRMSFFALQQMVNSLLTAITLLLVGFLSDMMQKSGSSLNFFIALRIVAFLLALLECFVYMAPKEKPHEPTKENTSILAVLQVPARHKKYAATIVIVFLWIFGSYLPASAWDVRMLRDIGIPYAFINALSAGLSLASLALIPLWRQFLRRLGWFTTFGIATMLYLPLSATLAFITNENYAWLYLLVRILQLLFGIGINLSYANITLVNLPKSDQTSCLSFAFIVGNGSAFLGQVVGAFFVKIGDGLHFTVFGTTHDIVSVLLWAQAAIFSMAALYALLRGKKLQPTAQPAAKPQAIISVDGVEAV